jgi:purine nucleosidase
MAAQKVIIDTDPATGYAFRDVDDGLAILYLLARPPEFDILGITPVHGNAPLSRTVPKACEVVRIAGRDDVPVFAGAKSKRQLGRETPASLFMKRAVGAYPGEVTVLALGPLTNLATAGREPGFYESLARVVVMGGTIEQGIGVPLISPLEFNFFKDPEAADAVLAAPCEKVIVTADLCKQALFTRRELDSLWLMRSRVATYLAYRIEPWLRLNQVVPVFPGGGGFVPWDVVAAVYLRRPELFGEPVEQGIHLREGRFRTGALDPDPSRDGVPVITPMRLEPAAILDEFLEAINLYPL